MPVEQIRRSINKNSVAVKVKAKRAELSEIIAEMNNPNFPKEVTSQSSTMDMISRIPNFVSNSYGYGFYYGEVYNDI